MSTQNRLAIDDGAPVRAERLPFFRVSYGHEEREEVLDVFERGVFGSVYPDAVKVRALEEAFAEYVGTAHAVAFSSGTTAQHASLVAAGVGPGDEVIVPPLTFASTAYTVLMVGATPVFADVDDETITLDPKHVAEAVTSRTRVIVPVHWFGVPAAMDELMEVAAARDIVVIEDCAHAYGTAYRGRKAGTIGTMSCWSMQQSKVLTSAGEGGVLVTDDVELANVARSVGDHGKQKPQHPGETGSYSLVRVGNNYRMSEMHAAFGLAQIRRAESIQAARRSHGEYLDEGLKRLSGVRRPTPGPDVEPGYSYYAVRFDEEAHAAGLRQIAEGIEAEGVEVVMIAEEEYAPAHPLFRENGPPDGLPVAERIRRELLLLPLYPDLTRQDLDDIVEAVTKVSEAYARRYKRFL